MFKPFFGQAMSTILTAALIGQFTLGSSIAVAQASNFQNDPYWSNAGVDPKNSNFWFNQAPGSDPTQPNSNDPWGSNWGSGNNSTWGDTSGTWSNLGSNQGWDPSNNPYGGLGDMWGNSSTTNVRPTDPLYVQFMRWSGVVSKNYAAVIKAKRVKYGAYSSEDNDYLADQIIKEWSLRAAQIGAGAAVIPSLFATLQAVTPGLNNLSPMYGYGGGMAMGTLGDYFGVIVAQANMMYSLQELYGELSTDDDERTGDSTFPFVAGSTAAAVSNYFAKQLMVAPSYPQPPPPDPGPAPIPEPPVNPPPQVNPANQGVGAEKVAAQEGTQIAENTATQTESQIAGRVVTKDAATDAQKSFAEKVLFRWSQKLAARREAKGALNALDRQADELIIKNKVVEKLEQKAATTAAGRSLLTGPNKHFFLKWLQGLPSPIRLIAAASISFTVNYADCRAMGYYFKRAFRTKHRYNLANVVHTLRTYPAARAAIWLILIRDIFPHMGDEETAEGKKAVEEDSRMYASILMNEIPLVINARHNELHSILHDFYEDGQKNGVSGSKLIDKYLALLRHPLPIEAKLEMIKVIYAAALMKGYPTAHEMQTVDTVAVGLGLKPPPNVNTAQLEQHPEDPRMQYWYRYDDLIFRMNKAVQEQQFTAAGANPVKPKNYKQAQRWRSGQIVLQDFNETGVPDINKVMDEIKKSGGLITPQISKDAQCAANNATFGANPWDALNTGTTGSGSGSGLGAGTNTATSSIPCVVKGADPSKPLPTIPDLKKVPNPTKDNKTPNPKTPDSKGTDQKGAANPKAVDPKAKDNKAANPKKDQRPKVPDTSGAAPIPQPPPKAN